jgi:hypothetical protein
MRKLLPLCALLLLVGATSAFAAGKGSSMFSLQLGQGQGDFVNVLDPFNEQMFFQDSYLGPNSYVPRDQIQFGVEYWYMFSEDYALTGALAVGTWNEKQEAGNLRVGESASDFKDFLFKSSSVRARIGADRVGRLGESFEWFMGPGLEIWSGKTKESDWYVTYANNSSGDYLFREFESPNMTRFGINGRVGGTFMLTPQIGVTGRVGHSFGRASAEDRGAKTTWLSTTWDAMWGLTFAFGGAR